MSSTHLTTPRVHTSLQLQEKFHNNFWKWRVCKWFELFFCSNLFSSSSLLFLDWPFLEKKNNFNSAYSQTPSSSHCQVHQTQTHYILNFWHFPINCFKIICFDCLKQTSKHLRISQDSQLSHLSYRDSKNIVWHELTNFYAVDCLQEKKFSFQWISLVTECMWK